MVWDESNLVVERVNNLIITQANLTQAAISSVLSKKGGGNYQRMVASLNVETKARDKAALDGDEEVLWPQESAM